MREFTCSQCDEHGDGVSCVLTADETANAPEHCPFPSDSGDDSATWVEHKGEGARIPPLRRDRDAALARVKELEAENATLKARLKRVQSLLDETTPDGYLALSAAVRGEIGRIDNVPVMDDLAATEGDDNGD